MRTFSAYYGTSTATPANSDGDIARLINNTLPDNLTWALEELNQSLRYLTTTFYFNERSYTITTTAATQFYNLPPQVKKLINVTVLIGSTLWQPKECPSREYWDYLNTIAFNQDYPSFFFVYNGQVGLWPTPSSSGNTITMNYKTRIVDLSMPDVTSTSASSTISAINASNILTTAGTADLPQWLSQQWIRIPHSATTSLNGDNQWYQIDIVYDGHSNSTGSLSSGSNLILTTGSFFVSTDVGAFITSTGIPSGSVITAVLGSNSARISNNATTNTSSTSIFLIGSHVALKNKYTGSTVVGANFTAGETPILPEDYQDLPIYRMAYLYYTTRFPDPVRAKLYKDLYDTGYAALNDEFGSKTTNVILTDTSTPIFNPNLYQSGIH